MIRRSLNQEKSAHSGYEAYFLTRIIRIKTLINMILNKEEDCLLYSYKNYLR
jgi:hypothetical protein